MLRLLSGTLRTMKRATTTGFPTCTASLHAMPSGCMTGHCMVSDRKKLDTGHGFLLRNRLLSMNHDGVSGPIKFHCRYQDHVRYPALLQVQPNAAGQSGEMKLQKLRTMRRYSDGCSAASAQDSHTLCDTQMQSAEFAPSWPSRKSQMIELLTQ